MLQMLGLIGSGAFTALMFAIKIWPIYAVVLMIFLMAKRTEK